METSLSSTPDIEDRQLNPSDRPKLPEGVVITHGEAIITARGIALEMFDKDFSVFIIDENGEAMYVDSRAEIENHNGGFSSMPDEVYKYLDEKEKSIPARTQDKTEINDEQRETALTEIALLTGISATRLIALPPDILGNVTSAYLQNIGKADDEELAERVNSALISKPQTVIAAERETENGSVKTAEDIVGDKNPMPEAAREKTTAPKEKPSILAFLKAQQTAKSEPPAPAERV